MLSITDIIKGKQQPISSQELASLLLTEFKAVQEEDLKAIIEGYIGEEESFSKEQSIIMAENIRRQLDRLQPSEQQLSKFYFNDLLTVQNNEILIKDMEIQTGIDVDEQFIDVIGEDFYKKLINYASNGLLFLKSEEKPVRRYTFFQWVQNNIDLNLQQQHNLHLLLLKQTWAFKFLQIPDTISKIKIAFPQDKEISSIELGLNIFVQIFTEFTGNEELKQKFVDRKEFSIKLENDHNNKKEQKDFNNTISEIKQQLLFAASYFDFVKKNFNNKIYYAIAQLLSNRQDNFVKQGEDPIIIIRQLSIVDRFFYAKRFYRSQDFQSLKKQLMDNHQKDNNLEQIVLYGIRKQSELILQNYIDETNQIEKVATICVLLKLLLEQSKVGTKQAKTAFFNKIIKYYQFLLICIDSGISKHKFDKKCITIQVQRKKKTMNKTFKFNCVNCKYSQCLLSISKRILADTRQTQPRMKGNNLYAKDPRNQVRHCLDCMELLPKCCVCLYPITVYNGYVYAEEMKSSLSRPRNKGQPLENALVWCPKCFHGGHFSHIMKWMQQSQKRCPVANCKCKCER